MMSDWSLPPHSAEIKSVPTSVKLIRGNVVKFGHTAKGTQRYQCKIIAWLQVAADHVEEIEALMLANYNMTRVQMDAMWSYVGHKGE